MNTPGETHGTTGPTSKERDMAWRVCSTPGCGKLHQRTGRCPDCRTQADKARRPHGSPYGTSGHRGFREQVLARDPICTLCLAARSTVADHYPTERRDLVAQGLDPNDPQYGRGLCK
ncbi:MAG TPA: hypothetical protein VIO38_16770, partial [Rariglobus sp.]